MLDYADRLFSVGEELKQALRERPGRVSEHFRVGVADMVAKSMAHRLIAPALALPDPPRLSCREGRFAELLAQLAIHRLDLVISDRPMHASMNVRGYNHLLVECGISFLAAPPLARRLRRGFPQSLDGAPMLLPAEDAALRPRLLAWFDTLKVRPQVVADFDDTALMKAFGQAGSGVFPVPALIADALAAQLGTPVIGDTAAVIERVYAVSTERRIRHPAVAAISEAAQVLMV